MYEQAGCLLFLLCCFRLGKILHGNAFAGIGLDALLLRYLGDFHIPDKAIVDYDSLCSAFANTLCFKHINVVYKFPEKRCGQLVHSHESADCRSEVFAFPIRLRATKFIIKFQVTEDDASVNSFILLSSVFFYHYLTPRISVIRWLTRTNSFR